MLVTTKGILLKSTIYGENGRILKIFTMDHGLETFFVNSIKTRSAAVKPSFLQPLTISEIVYTQKSNANFQRISEYRCLPALHSIYTDPVKLSIILFMQEMLNKCVVEKFHHPALFHFVSDTLLYLEQAEKNHSVIPVAFMSKLAGIMGFSPNIASFSPGSVLTTNEGIFEYHAANNSEDAEASALIVTMSTTDYHYLASLQVARNIREKISEQINRLFTYHLPGFKISASGKILGQVLAS